MLMRKYWGVSLVVLSAAGFGIMPIMAVYAYRAGIGVNTLLFLRFAIAAGLFFGYLLLSKQLRMLSWREVGALFLLGAVGYNAEASCYFYSLKYINPSLTALLLYTYPILVAFLGFILNKERPGRRLGAAILLSFAGLTLALKATWDGTNLIGVGLGFAAALVYSCYITAGNRTVKSVPPLTTSAYVALFAMLSFLVKGLADRSLTFHFPVWAWLPVAAIAVCSTVVAIFGFFKGMELIGPTAASAISMIEPLVTMGLSVLLLREKVGGWQWLGAFIVLAGAALAVLEKQEPKQENRKTVVAIGNG